jgi:peptidoglycan/xylan/chitin deacetylase (PgdA/CDA1 family)
MVITTSWDDGDALDERLADMLDRHGLRGTFYIAQTHRRHRLLEAGIRTLAARHEIGAHSLSHSNLTRLDRAAKTREVAGSKSWLEDVTGKPVAMFCYPLGLFDDETKRVVGEAGFCGARTTGQFSLTPHQDRFAMRTTLQVHPILFRHSTVGDLGRYLVRQGASRGNRWAALKIGVSMFRGWSGLADFLLAAAALDDSHVFHLWGHSWEIEEHGMWRECDAFLRSISMLGYRTRSNGEICQSLCVPATPPATPPAEVSRSLA